MIEEKYILQVTYEEALDLAKNSSGQTYLSNPFLEGRHTADSLSEVSDEAKKSEDWMVHFSKEVSGTLIYHYKPETEDNVVIECEAAKMVMVYSREGREEMTGICFTTGHQGPLSDFELRK